jgi:predicted phage terminase large subunit-like protein
MQTPSPDEGGEWKKDWFEIIKKQSIPAIKWNMYIDGAYTKNNSNDPTGIQISGKFNNDYIILTSIDKYLEMPELLKFIPEFIKAVGVPINMIYVEPKASGKSIAQLIKQQTRLNISEIKSDFVQMSKIERARSVSPFIESGRVKLVEGAWNETYLQQIAMFPNAKHDEHVDLTCYGIEKELMQKSNSLNIRL